MKKCNNCGTMNEDNSQFCGKCGSSLSSPMCYYHRKVPAICKCTKCGRAICQQCAFSGKEISRKFKDGIFCQPCYQELVQWTEDMKEHKKNVAGSVWDVFKAFFEAVLKIIGLGGGW